MFAPGHPVVAKALVLVNATVLEIFQWDLVAKALLLVNPTETMKGLDTVESLSAGARGSIFLLL